ncbi:MAG: alpha/beta hydrolase [Thermoanaerobaculia bacterium]|nr:alpha/beta hydrolase [Thermoanaerobaculia bacterium]
MNGAPDIIGPASQFYISQRLRLHYLDWGNQDKPLLLLIHGGRDHAHNWDWVARRLRQDYHVVAPDLRGHGDSAWAIGGMYTQSDFVLDVVQLLDALDDYPVRILGHSLGGAIALHYTGTYPDKVEKLIAIEGMGPPPEMLDRRRGTDAWKRMADWIARMQDLAGRMPRRYESVEAAMQRMQEANAHLSDEQARHLTVHGVARNEDGTYSWKFDNYVRALGPYQFSTDDLASIWGRIGCPTLLVRGTESWASDPEEDGRIAAFQNARLVNFTGAGHWVHHDQLEEFLAVASDFLADGDSGGP